MDIDSRVEPLPNLEILQLLQLVVGMFAEPEEALLAGGYGANTNEERMSLVQQKIITIVVVYCMNGNYVEMHYIH